ncbi:hypothetical protein [Roseovarius sp. MBR-6]|jgi:hypothetical protein|uniref:hypothetical protein n=1 Tax=Roseovarius sp. MBR-6 TaxID=3156459 RepID=UPI00339B53D2
MMFNFGSWRRRLAVLVIVTKSLTGCVTVGSEVGDIGTGQEIIEAAGRIDCHRDDGRLCWDPRPGARLQIDSAHLGLQSSLQGINHPECLIIKSSTSSCLPFEGSHAARCSTVAANWSVLRSEHSQTFGTCHPAYINWSRMAASRITFTSNFACQKLWTRRWSGFVTTPLVAMPEVAMHEEDCLTF